MLRDQDGRRIVFTESWVMMLSLMEKLEDLKVGLDNDTYINVILQSLPPFYDPFIINYNMNGFETSIHKLINMLVQYEAMTHKLAPVVLVGDDSTSKAKGKRVGRWKRKKGKGKVFTATASASDAPTSPIGKENGKEKIGGSQRSKANDICMHCQEKGHWKRECPQLLSNPGARKKQKTKVTLLTRWPSCLTWHHLRRYCWNRWRTSRLGIEGPTETCTKYCSRVSSPGDVGHLCSFSMLVGKSHAYEDCILHMASGGCIVRHGHHKPYPVHSEYVARMVDSKRGSVPYHYMTESSLMHLEMV
ncbi:hypothetical protein Sango_1170300 [Sesamum angolense]|uniref:CCHC-type domain-containing protein n=1 Tax=Sesamum angolense TaxID=2727404 RepID=A0AAE1WW18_9LAMI|nr:hypothetical protein Sango_1170300 [Sesamum angolense]